MLLSDRLDEAKIEAEQLSKRFKNLQTQNKKLKTQLKTYKSIDAISKVDVVVEMAEESALSPHEWVVMRVAESIESDANNDVYIPVKQEFYDKFSKLARTRGLTVDKLAFSSNMTRWLNRGISNNCL